MSVGYGHSDTFIPFPPLFTQSHFLFLYLFIYLAPSLSCAALSAHSMFSHIQSRLTPHNCWLMWIPMVICSNSLRYIKTEHHLYSFHFISFRSSVHFVYTHLCVLCTHRLLWRLAISSWGDSWIITLILMLLQPWKNNAPNFAWCTHWACGNECTLFLWMHTHTSSRQKRLILLSENGLNHHFDWTYVLNWKKIDFMGWGGVWESEMWKQI